MPIIVFKRGESYQPDDRVRVVDTYCAVESLLLYGSEIVMGFSVHLHYFDINCSKETDFVVAEQIVEVVKKLIKLAWTITDLFSVLVEVNVSVEERNGGVDGGDRCSGGSIMHVTKRVG